jgi:hypothetical protein
MKKSVGWLQKNSQQDVFMKVANFPPIIRNGPRPVITQTKRARSDDEKAFKVGQSEIGGEETIRK